MPHVIRVIRFTIAASMLAACAAPALAAAPCKPANLRLSLDQRDGELNGMSHAGAALSIRNLGPGCTLASPPTVMLRDARGITLPARARATPAAHSLVYLGGGQRALLVLRWIAGPVFTNSHSVQAAELRLRFGRVSIAAPLDARMYGEASRTVEFDQGPLRVIEDMAADPRQPTPAI